MSAIRQPDFNNLLDVLARKEPPRPVLFEFMVCGDHLRRLLGDRWLPDDTPFNRVLNWVNAFAAAGFDHATFPIWEAGLMDFPGAERDRLESVGMAHAGVITDEASFDAYPWPDPGTGDMDMLARFGGKIPDGMKLIVFGPCGVLENLIKLVGYEDLCLMLEDAPALVRRIADAIGSRLVKLYELYMQYDIVGAAFVNDDWGFKTQMFLSPAQMRELVIPWHRRIVEVIHRAGRPAILHSCGQIGAVWGDVIEDLKMDGKHSYEDAILPVEAAYEKYGSRIAILGGIDLDFLCRSTPEEIARRSSAMLERARGRGGYALGSGNSIPPYVPYENWRAMCEAALI